VIAVLVLVGCVAAIPAVRNMTMPSSPYTPNNKFSYQDLDEDRDNIYQAERSGSLPGNNNKGDSLKSSSTGANNEFNFNSPAASAPENNLIDTDACMGFNIPKSTAEWGAPPAFESPPKHDNVLIRTDSQAAQEPLPQKSVVTNPFFGGFEAERPRSDSKTPIIDL